ncbi:MAG: DUF4326 domain-containing protein [Micromonosporaceae bacterium]
MTRARPWRHAHPDAVKVDRSTKWGNPYSVIEHGRPQAIGMFRTALLGGKLAVTVEDVRRELVGRDLACWCRMDQECHADVLIEVANHQHV